MSLNLRRLQIVKDVLFAEAGTPAPKPITRAAALAVIANPFAGRHVQLQVAAFRFAWPSSLLS